MHNKRFVYDGEVYYMVRRDAYGPLSIFKYGVTTESDNDKIMLNREYDRWKPLYGAVAAWCDLGLDIDLTEYVNKLGI